MPHTSPQSPSLITIRELFQERFHIAEYQRGYKWKSKEVELLLKDINDFKQDTGNFYCLQPVTVANTGRVSDSGNPVWELVDGQQRVTTLYLILRYLGEQVCAPTYRTREGSHEFLEKIRDSGIQRYSNWNEWRAGVSDNIDNYHFFEAYKTIINWFSDNVPGEEEKNALKEKLLGKVKVIWHEVKTTDCKNTFLNINSGKIRLNNAELIKALFLKQKNLEGDSAEFRRWQLEIAQEWDQIEYSLREESFWFFINKGAKEDKRPARIGFIFDLLVPEPKNDAEKADEFYTFFNYSNIGGDWDPEKAWKDVKTCHQTLREWFERRDYYHDAGFLIIRGIATLRELYEKYRGSSSTKEQFRMDLESRITVFLKFGGRKSLDTLSYEEDRKALNDVLLLINIKTLGKDENGPRFPFDLYQKEAWSLEHIHARNANDPDTDEAWETWADDLAYELEMADEEPEAKAQAVKIREWTETDMMRANIETRKAAKRQFEESAKAFISDSKVHGLGNLALLGRQINSSLSNSSFKEKREKIIEWDKEGSFIPISTKNVFLKYYGGDIGNLEKWTKADRDAYFVTIKELLNIKS